MWNEAPQAVFGTAENAEYAEGRADSFCVLCVFCGLIPGRYAAKTLA
jgi:hypothetical protein